MLKIIDYGVGNTLAFANVFTRLNIPFAAAKTEQDLEGASKLILPGVGSFDHAMKSFNNSGMRERVEHMVLNDDVPVIGICVGMQMLATGSEEGEIEGLNWIPGMVRKFDFSHDNTLQVPHMGWNDIQPKQAGELFIDMPADPQFYFLHSYYYDPDSQEDSYAETEYGSTFTVAVKRKNIFGVQFHPEKSHSNGHSLLKNFAEI